VHIVAFIQKIEDDTNIKIQSALHDETDALYAVSDDAVEKLLLPYDVKEACMFELYTEKVRIVQRLP
jgi:hypothetical protein